MEQEKDPLVNELASLRIDRGSQAKATNAPPSLPIPLTWIGIAVAVVVVGGIGWLLANRAAPKAIEVETVRIAAPGRSSGLLTANGYIISQNKAALGFARGGKIRQIFVKESDAVSKGQVLATLENLELEARRDEARRDFARKKSLYAEQLISKKEIEDAETHLKVAEAQWQDTIIRAPFSGVVVQKLGEVGETISAIGGAGGTEAQGVIVMADLHHMSVEVDINETNLGQVSLGTSAEIAPDAFPGQVYKGRLSEIRPSADRAKATVRVKVAIDNPNGKLLPDMGARVTFLPPKMEPESKKAIQIPNSTIRKEGNRNFVFVVEGDKARRREVKIGEGSGNMVEVKSGLVGGEEIILSKGSIISDGQVVKTKGGSNP